MMIVPLQLKIKNFYNELNTLKNNNKVMFIYNDDKEFFTNVEKYGIRLLN